MSGGGVGRALPAAQLLRRAAAEADDLSVLLRDLERVICEGLSHGLPHVADRRAQLQSLDLLTQRLRGLSSCLLVVAAAAGDNQEIPVLPLLLALPLGSQRAALLRGVPADPGGRPPELF